MTQKDEINHVTSNKATPNGTVEGEPLKQPFPRAKRHSTAQESTLPKIQENDEGKKGGICECVEKESVVDNSQNVQKNRYNSSSFSIFQTEIEYEEPEVADKDKDSPKLEHKRSIHKRVSSSGVVSQESVKCDSVNTKNESRIAHVDDVETNVTKQSSQSRHHSCSESRRSSLSSIPKFDLRNSGSQMNDLSPNGQVNDSVQQHRVRSISTSSSGDVNIKLPKVNCVHKNGIHVGEKVGRTVKWRTEKDNCTLCQVPDEMIKNAQEQANKLLLDIVYPHEFYDKFSRARQSRKSSLNQSTPKDTITICKPAKVTRKIVQQEKTWNRISGQNDTIRVPEEGGVLQYSTVPEKRRKHEIGEEVENVKKEIHVQCKAKANAVVVTDEEKGQKMVLKGLKGWLLKKHDECKNKTHIDLRQSLYQVSTLGMQFSLPEYNNSLHDRKPQSPRPMTSVTSRSQDNASVLRPNTHNIGPRQRTMPSIPRDLYPGQSRGFGALQRDLTTIPTRVPPTVTENGNKRVLYNSNINSSMNSSHKNLENAIAKVLKTGLSLPPIGSDVKTPVSLGHSPT